MLFPTTTFRLLRRSCAAALLIAGAASAAERTDSAPGSLNKKPTREAAGEVELFAAIEAGELEVQIIPRDSTEARLLLKNKSTRPLRVQLPAAFAATPVLAQIGGGGLAAGAGGGGAQAVGGGGGGMGFGGPGGVGAGGGFFNVPAERVGKLNVPLVCLEHGKKEPRPAIPYKIVPIEQFSSDPVLRELLVAFGKGNADQRAAQAAAWHLTDGLSWDELARKKIERLAGPDEPYFTRRQLDSAAQLVGQARHSAAEQSPTPHGSSESPGERAQ